MGKSQLIVLLQDTVRYLRVQNYAVGSRNLRSLLRQLQEDAQIREALFGDRDGGNAAPDLLAQMMEALEAEDLVLVADLLEEGLLPLLQGMADSAEPFVSGRYSVEPTSSGLLTARHLPSGLYLHSNVNPMEEAACLVERSFDPAKGRYVVWGMGLGYHVARLYEAAAGAIRITVFEEDAELIELARKYGALSQLPAGSVTCTADLSGAQSGEGSVTCVADPSGTQFAGYVAQADVGILIHAPSVKKTQNAGLKNALMEFFPKWNSGIQLGSMLAVNFRSNLKHCTRNVDEIEGHIRGKGAVVVAAGPSLDHSIGFLRKACGEKVIVAVGTVWKKLLDLGIAADYAVVIDAQPRTFGQMTGLTDTRIPLIVDSTACWQFAANYRGEKYIAFQKGYDDAQRLAEESGCRVYETGGSVTTLALEIVLRLGAREVWLAGADFAFPGGLSHADGTMDRMQRDTSGMMPVRSVDGGVVYTDNLFMIYRKWVENKIGQYPEVVVHNLSDCGAYIEGARHMEGNHSVG